MGRGTATRSGVVEGFHAMTATNHAYKSARRLRRDLSLPEKLLWRRFRSLTPRIRRQHPIGQYVLDFYCAEAKLAIEVDGMAHDMGDRPQRDETRMNWLNGEGIEVLRILAKQVLDDPNATADAVIAYCTERSKPLHQPASPVGPPPHLR